MSGTLYSIYSMIPALLVMLCAPPIIGLIADIRCGNQTNVVISFIAYWIFTLILINACLNIHYCSIIPETGFTVLSVVGFVVYCLLACWYKMRVRDEEYDVHRVVEEVYDRYLSQRHYVINK